MPAHLPMINVNRQTTLFSRPVPIAMPCYSFAQSTVAHDVSFDGVGVFNEGRLHLGPFSAIDGQGIGFSFS